MIKKIGIENYKSIEKLDLEIGRVNIFIGENGCGKTNILEAVAFASCFGDIDNSKLSLKGIRATEPKFYKNGFHQPTLLEEIKVIVHDDDNNKSEYSFNNANEPYAEWDTMIVVNDHPYFVTLRDLYKAITSKDISKGLISDETLDLAKNLKLIREESNSFFTTIKNMDDILQKEFLPTYILFSPENYFLRTFNIETAYCQPLGTKGEGLLKLIKVIKQEKPNEYKEIIEHLHIIDWFSDIEISDDNLSGTEFKVADVYLEDGIKDFDIRNANEGFFLLLFYITLFVSDYTPSFFAIDNIDTALNPKLCTRLIEILAQLAQKHNKQVLITTQNPAILDGINLNDTEQRLFAVSRNKMGHTKVSRIEKKPPLEGEKSLKLSEQFLRGYIGGIPKNF